MTEPILRTPRRPLTTCPVCSGDLVTTRLGCHSCGTELVGEFGSCSFCALDDADLELLRVFLVSRGNLRELEKHLGVSYPTARARFHALLRKLGLADEPGGDEPEVDDPTADHRDADEPDAGVAADERAAGTTGDADDRPTGHDSSGDGRTAGGGGDAASVRDQVLAQVASGALAPEVAADLLRRLG